MNRDLERIGVARRIVRQKIQRTSYLKSIALALAVALVALAGLLAVAVVPLPGFFRVAACLVLGATMFVALSIVAGGMVCLWRDNKIESGLSDPIGVSLKAAPTSEPLSAVGLRSLLGKSPRPGDMVEVRSLDEIQSTLDTDSALDGLPFMPEMAAYCGHVFRVHRCVDKIYDMRHKTGMRRLSGVVSLAAVRCDGASHDGCQAGCQILWKHVWLRRVSAETTKRRDAPMKVATATDTNCLVANSYVCQMTRLWEASAAMSRFDIRQDLRPLLSGNVGLWIYVLVLLVRFFNRFQQLRGGIKFPYMPERRAADPPVAVSPQGLASGDHVIVQDRAHIAQTLVNNKAKGLWYDRDMVRYCGNESIVVRGVDKLIHEGTGVMVTIKTRCWILRDLTATGEFHRLCPQNEHIFWREAWLKPRSVPSEPQRTAKD